MMSSMRDMAAELAQPRHLVLDETRRRTLWLIQLRWLVPPAIFVATWFAEKLGFEFISNATYILAVAILAYNCVFYFLGRGVAPDDPAAEDLIHRLAAAQAGMDYVAMFFLVQFTGGAASPFIFFFILHIIFAGILLPPRTTYFFAGLVSIGMLFIAFGEFLGWIPHHAITYGDKAIDLAFQPMHMSVELVFFAASAFSAAFFTSRIMLAFRARVQTLDEQALAIAVANQRLEAMYGMVAALRHHVGFDELGPVVARELTDLMHVQGVSIKLLSPDGAHLHVRVAHGLPAGVLAGKDIEVAASPPNRRIVEGESFVTGAVARQADFPFKQELQEAGLQSIILVPLKVEDKVIGVLGAYSFIPDAFRRADVDFLEMTAGLVAVALAASES